MVLLRIVLCITATSGWGIACIDIAQAFLNATLDEGEYEYVYLPPGFSGNKGKDRYVLKVKRALYGLRQSPKKWNDTVSEYIRGMSDMKQSKVHKCLFFKPGLMVIVHVDDFLIAGEPEKIKWFSTMILEKFKGKNTDPSDFLGLCIEQNEHCITLSAKVKVVTLLEEHGLFTPQTHIKNNPMQPELLEKMGDQGEANTAYVKEIQSLLGSLLYISGSARPDITFAVNYLCRFTHCPTKAVYSAVKRVLRYLKGTTERTLVFKRPCETPKHMVFKTYVDAGTQCYRTRRWTTGYVCYLNGTAIDWQSKRQGLVCLSTCEAELVALTEATVNALFIRKLLLEQQLISPTPIEIYCDNKSTIAKVTNDHVQGNRTRHIDTKYMYAREQQREFNTIKVEYVATDKNCADGFTKPLSGTKHEAFSEMLFLPETHTEVETFTFNAHQMLSALHDANELDLQTKELKECYMKLTRDE